MNNIEDRNKRILQTLETKIAMEKFEQESLAQNRRKEGVRSYIALKVGAAATLLGLVAGNIYSFATYKKDMFSVILEKMGIFSEYQNTGKDINMTSYNNEFKLVLTDYGIDEDTLIIGYDLELPKKIENKIYFLDNSKLKCEEKIWEIDTNSNIESFTKVNDTNYKIYKFYKIDSSKLGKDIEFDTDITLYEELDELHSNNLANWSFKTNLENDKVNLKNEKYIVNNKKTDFASILEVSKSSLSTKITILLKPYHIEPGVKYYVEILDDSGNVILENNIEALIGGAPTDVIFKKIDFNKKLIINICETYGTKIEHKETMTLDLEKDLVRKSEKKDSEKESQSFRDIEFKYPKGLETYETTYNEGMGDEEVYYFDITLTNNVGNEQIADNLISISCYKNLYDENLETIVENMHKLEYLGGYRLSKEYTIFSAEDNTLKEDVILNHKQIIDLADGKNINVNGTMLNVEMIKETLHNIKVEDKKTVKIDSKNAITWLETYGEDCHRKYVFEVDEYIYEISCPTDFNNQDNVEEFIDSIIIH